MTTSYLVNLIKSLLGAKQFIAFLIFLFALFFDFPRTQTGRLVRYEIVRCKNSFDCGIVDIRTNSGGDRFGIDLREINELKVGKCYVVHYTSSLFGIRGAWAKFERKDNAC